MPVNVRAPDLDGAAKVPAYWPAPVVWHPAGPALLTGTCCCGTPSPETVMPTWRSVTSAGSDSGPRGPSRLSSEQTDCPSLALVGLAEITARTRPFQKALARTNSEARFFGAVSLIVQGPTSLLVRSVRRRVSTGELSWPLSAAESVHGWPFGWTKVTPTFGLTRSPLMTPLEASSGLSTRLAYGWTGARCPSQMAGAPLAAILSR